MQFTLDSSKGNYHLKAYEPGQFSINDDTFQQSIILTQTQLINPWAPQCFADLQAEHLQTILDTQPEVILLGTGEKQQFPKGKLYQAIIELGIGVDIMDTASACRTFCVLSAEGRQVTAALIVK